MAGYIYRGTTHTDEDPTPPAQHQAKDGRNHLLSPCGTLAAYKRHKRMGEEACDPCKNAQAAAIAKYRGGTTTGKRRAKKAVCGTYSAAVQHRKKHEPVDFACRLAESQYKAERKARKEAA